MRLDRRLETALLIVILIAAAALRLTALDDIPPGLTHDEANNVHDAASVLRGAFPFYFPVAQGKEPLYPYSVAAMMSALGATPFAMRLTSAFWGILLVALTYRWTRQNFDRVTALWTSAGLAVSFWGVSTSRLGLRAITLPVFLLASFLVLRAASADRLRPGRAIIAGLLLGLTFYTYLAARVMPVLVFFFGLYLLVFHRDHLRRRWRDWSVSLLVAAITAAPLFLYLRAHPSAEIRLGQLDQPLQALLQGDPSPLLNDVAQAMGAFSFSGDGFIPYNIPGRPIFDPVMSLLFYAGVLISLLRWRQPTYAFALLWFTIGFFPAWATGIDALHLRAIGAQPVTFLFPAVALETLRSVVRKRSGASGNRFVVRWPVYLGSLAFVAVALFTGRDYFVTWPNDRDVRVHYHVDLLAIAQNIEGLPDDAPLAISALFPGQYHDPRVVQAMWSDENPPLIWFDGRQSLALPSSATAGLVVPDVVRVDRTLWDFVAPFVTLQDRYNLRPDDFDPAFEVYEWHVNETLDAIHSRITSAAQPAQLPVNVGEQLAFEGYLLQGWSRQPPGEFDLLTLWQVKAPLPEDRDAVFFTQLLDDQSRVIAQRDQLGVPSWNWRVGDRIVQLHRLSLPGEVAPGDYTLIAGVYTVPDRVDAVLAGHEPDPETPRLLVYENGSPVRDHIILTVLKVR